METYFKIKSFIEFGIPVFLFALCVLIILLIIIWAAWSSHREDKIKKYMLANGYEYYLRNVASFGGKAWWAYRKENVSIDEEDLYRLTFRKIKKKYK